MVIPVISLNDSTKRRKLKQVKETKMDYLKSPPTFYKYIVKQGMLR